MKDPKGKEERPTTVIGFCNTDKSSYPVAGLNMPL
jgi:hypothetical protein